MEADGRLELNAVGASIPSDTPPIESLNLYSQAPEEHWDYISGMPLDSTEVKKAREEELQGVRRHGVYEKVPP